MIDLKNIPNIHFFCTGASEGKTELTSFDGALLKAGIGNTNLIKMSSILPPNSKEVKPFLIKPGSFIPLAYADMTSSEPGKTISAAVAISIPDDRNLNGVIMEHHDAAPISCVEAKVREMAKEAMEMRGIKNYTIKSKGIEHKVVNIATAFAAVVLWDSKMTEE
ncbi:MAG: pyruvoyl-dependent arginine decarboxylase [bacterium]